ncbi:MAG: right-handed parallel beta-helix repeat-containing protein [Spirochaetales bacterium]|nr:right-handed parallel beta-helix repeat-containing protein [Spirochaetales bacterium]
MKFNKWKCIILCICLIFCVTFAINARRRTTSTSTPTPVPAQTATPAATSTSTPTSTMAAQTNNPTSTPTAPNTATPTAGSGITVDLTEGGTSSAQYDDSPSAERYPNVFDNSSATKYLTFHASGWVQYQFSGNSAYAVNRYTVTSANDAEERDPLSWTLSGSNDGSGFTTVDTRSGQDFANRFQTNTYSISNTTAFRYYRITMNNNSGTILQVAEVQLFGETGSTAAPTTANTATSTAVSTSTSSPTTAATSTPSPTTANTSTPAPSPTSVSSTAIYLYESGDQVVYGSPGSNDYSSHWQVLVVGDGYYRIQNRNSGEYMHVENLQAWVQCGTIYDIWYSARWAVEDYGSYVLLRNAWQPSNYIHIRDRLGYAQQGTVDTGQNEARWVLQSVDGTYVRIMSYQSGPTATPSSTSPPTNTPTPTNTMVPGSRGATMPYTRYEADAGSYGGGAVLRSAPTFDYALTASEASDQKYVALPSNGSYVEWTVSTNGAGVTMRFTMPDSGDGMGLNGFLDCLVNGTKVSTISLTSYYSWQYFTGGGQPVDVPTAGVAGFRFDEVHWKLPNALRSGDRLRIQKSNGDGIEYGVDFVEIEPVPAAISQPSNSLSVTSYGATPDDTSDDLAAFNACVTAAVSQGRSVYIPAGTFNLGNMWVIGSPTARISNITITGAGIWHTNLQFTSPNQSMGGISFRVSGVLDFGNVYLNSMLRTRYSQMAVYKAFMDDFGTNSRIHDFWEDHFECGFWVADYASSPAFVATGLVISNGRVRNNLADGINFCQGTSNSTVTNCSIRNNGDDGLAMWPNNELAAPMETNNTFEFCTIEHTWRASGVGIFGGSGHRIRNLYIKDNFMSAGLRLDTTFPGYHFDTNSGITFSDITIVNCGTSKDFFYGELGAVDLKAPASSVRNITFSNIDIYNTQRDAVEFGEGAGFSNIQFTNCLIDGTGKDDFTASKFTQPHLGMAIMSYTGNGSVTFTNLIMQNIEGASPYYLITPGFVLTFN